jgi:ABC-type nitrate/sulfonate/bicarbonate transport system substrate-binding protein
MNLLRRKILAMLVFCLAVPLAAPVSAQLTKIQVASGYDVTQGFWLVAHERGFDKKNGLDISVKSFEAAGLALEAVIAGDAVATGVVGGLPALRAKLKGADFVAVASALRAPKISCSVAIKQVAGPKDLEGKTVGLLVGSSSQFWFARYVAFHDVKNVTLKSLTPPETVSALRNGEIAAFFNWQPWCDRAESIVAGSHVLTIGGDNNLQPYADAMIVYRGDFARNQAPTALALLKTLDETMVWIGANPDESAQIMAKAYRGDATQFARDIKNITWGLKLDSWLRNYLNEEAIWMKENKLIEVADTKQLVDGLLYPVILQKIDPKRVD